jgi:hypothetical protein
MFDCTQISCDREKKVKNNKLEGEDVFIFMYKVDSRDLALNNVPAEHSCKSSKNQQDPSSPQKELTIIDPNALQI